MALSLQWALAALVLAVGLWLRVGLPYDNVIVWDARNAPTRPEVNFQETDAWYHVRLIEAYDQGGWRGLSAWDPLGSHPDGQRVDVGPVLDLGLMALHKMVPGVSLRRLAAWYPVLLWILSMTLCWLAAKRIFGIPAAWVAVGILAVAPGNYLRTSSFGFTDHHVLEGLLMAGMLWFWAGRRFLWAGGLLGLYLLTFHASAVLLAMLLAGRIWAGKRENVEGIWKTWALGLAVGLAAHDQLWMKYAIGVLVVALAVEAVFRFVPRPAWRWAIFGVGALGGLVLAERFGVFQLARHFGAGIGSETVSEMGRLTWPLLGKLYAGLPVLAAVAIAILVKDARPWGRVVGMMGLALGLMSIFQLRLGYYVTIFWALLAGFTVQEVWRWPGAARWRALLVPILAVVVFGPLAYESWVTNTQQYGLRVDWREALHWMRTSTPEPLDAPNAYEKLLPKGSRLEAKYGVLSWWDYGYAISAIGHRTPFTNPSHRNAPASAELLLTQSEDQFLAGMEKNKLRYTILSDDLVMMPVEGGILGRFPRIPLWRGERREDYFIRALVVGKGGQTAPLALFHERYFRTSLVRLAVFEGQAVKAERSSCVPEWLKEGEDKLKSLRCYQTEAEARRKNPGQALYSRNAVAPPVDLPAMARMRRVYASDEYGPRTPVGKPPKVQIFEVVP